MKKIKSYEELKESLIDNQVCQECLGEEFKVIRNSKGKWERILCSCVYNHSDFTNTSDKVALNSSVLDKYIPKAYQERIFDIEKFKNNLNIPNDLKDIRLNSLGTLLTALLNGFKTGILPKKSYFINAPNGFGKRVFVYNSIRELLSCKKKPSKLFDLKTLQQESFEKGSIYLNEVILTHDIIFIEVSPNSYKNDLTFLEQLANRCMSESIPLIVISSKSVYDLSEQYEDVVTFLGISHAENYQYNKIVLGGLEPSYIIEYNRYLRTKTKGKSYVNNNSNYNNNNKSKNTTNNSTNNSYTNNYEHEVDNETNLLLSQSQSNSSGIREGETIAEFKLRKQQELKLED